MVAVVANDFVRVKSDYGLVVVVLVLLLAVRVCAIDPVARNY